MSIIHTHAILLLLLSGAAVLIFGFLFAKSEHWRKENNLQQNVSSLKEELSRADQSLRSMAGKVSCHP